MNYYNLTVKLKLVLGCLMFQLSVRWSNCHTVVLSSLAPRNPSLSKQKIIRTKISSLMGHFPGSYHQINSSQFQSKLWSNTCKGGTLETRKAWLSHWIWKTICFNNITYKRFTGNTFIFVEVENSAVQVKFYIIFRTHVYL